MPAATESRVERVPESLGIVAGGGELPARLVSACEIKGIKPFVVAFKSQTDLSIVQGREHIVSRPGAAGSILRALKDNNVRDLVMIGAMRRPHLWDICPDWYSMRFLWRLGVRALGDNKLLTAIRRQLESDGFTIHGAQEFLPELLMPSGLLTGRAPDRAASADIQLGIKVTQTLGALDVGQAAIVQDGVVIGVEGVEGTDALIRRCATLRNRPKGGILVKTCKPQQDRDLDLPAIGPRTVKLCAELGYAGIAVEAEGAIVLDPQDVAAMADAAGMFVMGIDVKKDG